jgi:hypothetical protein
MSKIEAAQVAAMTKIEAAVVATGLCGFGVYMVIEYIGTSQRERESEREREPSLQVLT